MRAFDTAAENVAPGTAVVGAESKSASAGEGPVAADVVGAASAPGDDDGRERIVTSWLL